jgi:hypothetical protein
MSPTESKMQHTIHLDGKVGHLPRPYPALPSKCIVDCIFYSVGLIITREIPVYFKTKIYFFTRFYSVLYSGLFT